MLSAVFYIYQSYLAGVEPRRPSSLTTVLEAASLVLAPGLGLDGLLTVDPDEGL